MGLVDYSDSESDGEGAPTQSAKPSAPIPAAKPVFQKAAPGKIQVSLPSLKAEPRQNGDAAAEPPSKRARTRGVFSGFNALLPAPKRTAQNAPKAGVSLKTSSEAAFSRNPLPQAVEQEEYVAPTLNEGSAEKDAEPAKEPKLVGKATRFLPLSVSGKKKKKPIAKPPPVANEQEAPNPKPKKSLFSVTQEDDVAVVDSPSGEYEPITIDRSTASTTQEAELPASAQYSTPADPNSLEAVAADLNLTPAQRRQLFGRQGKGANVTHFNLDAEYRKNEELRAAGEVVEHKAVKAIAPGKHSLQQLVNNARTQEDAMEDKWAEGRRARGEGSSKYGWSSGR
ncbi:uncharacterized protein MYCFIDRAFT_41987 [Pseudocercospora fijiensis CIRAD86]|uniref:Mitotic checkpoint regulator, MAD2B-interacting-domain-containing protein n=1 Tax=Pseudocercospora fijiensis (strain CIRAD86) TaxID=383855 RepID=M3AK32_PSEFD|nr:uncharacterized protein MYCFIDRAFT_41987 [Pseudocercospora fijiensis CIRAD86]EME84936.1 hypothetical protein MYCFIDRAFT_41987 [Pseudocercospora fijiensis CIRAD86]